MYEAILGSDGYALVPVTLNKAYEFIVISVDGYFRTESDTVEVSINSWKIIFEYWHLHIIFI